MRQGDREKEMVEGRKIEARCCRTTIVMRIKWNTFPTNDTSQALKPIRLDTAYTASSREGIERIFR